MASRGRPKKEEEVAIKHRDEKMIGMRKNGYPVKYIADYFGLSHSRICRILEKNNNNNSKVEKENSNG